MQSCFSSTATYHHPQLPTSEGIPKLVYRVHHSEMQTKYAFSEGFRSKNHTTILSKSSNLSRFGIAHLLHQTNISSPFISVYNSKSHAHNVAEQLATALQDEVIVVEIDTAHLARGPVFRAEDLMGEKLSEWSEEERWLHQGEYLVTYRIPAQALRGVTTKVGRVQMPSWMVVGSGRQGFGK